MDVEDPGEESPSGDEDSTSADEGTDEGESRDSPSADLGPGVRQVRGDVNKVTPPLISGGQGLVLGHVHPPGHPLLGPGPPRGITSRCYLAASKSLIDGIFLLV